MADRPAAGAEAGTEAGADARAEISAEAGTEAMAAAGAVVTAEASSEAGTEAGQEEDRRTWRPSRAPEHRFGQSLPPPAAIVERPEEGGVFGAITRFLRRPFVKLVLGLGLFILGAIVYDATVNFGSWTERKAKPKPTPHKGVPTTPTGS